jgi:3-hydroxyisobutyrate dehydrogenase-like beta-hydroxyacid dehydrogenase
MGLPICTRLVAAGFEVMASDRRAECEHAARHAGAAWARDLEQAVRDTEVVVTVLPGSDALLEIVPDVTSQLRQGSVWIDMTSAPPAVGREVVLRSRERNAECLDAPAGGGVRAAGAGELQLFVGGPAVVVERHRAMLETLGTVEHMGTNGAGYTTKLLVNLLWFGHAVATGEALLLGQRAGLDLDLLQRVISDSAGSSEFVRSHLPRLLGGDYLESFGLDRCCEELDAAASLAEELSVPFELSTAVRRAFGAALDRYGPVDGELLPIALLEERARTKLRSSLHGQSSSVWGEKRVS